MIKNFINKLGTDDAENLKIIKKCFKHFDGTTKDNETLLHLILEDKYHERQVLRAIKTLLHAGVNPNYRDSNGYNFIQTALYTGYSEELIINVMDEAFKYGLDVNTTDDDKDTIMHTAIYSDEFVGNINSIYLKLCEHGFDSTLCDNNGRNIIDACIYQNNDSDAETYIEVKEFEKLKELFEKEIKDGMNRTTLELNKTTDSNELNSFGGYVFKEDDFYNNPAIGREKEIEELMINLAQRETSMLVGGPGEGKTAIAHELIYRITKGQAPKFLENKEVVGIKLDEVLSNFDSKLEATEKIKNIINYCVANKSILFIDGFEKLINNNEIVNQINFYINKHNMTAFGTYDDSISETWQFSDMYKKIYVSSPERELLNEIIEYVIENHSNEKDLSTKMLMSKKEPFIEAISEFCIKTEDNIYSKFKNPKYAVSLIERSIACAVVEDEKELKLKHFAKVIDEMQIYDDIKDNAVASLKAIDDNENLINKKSKEKK